MATVSDITTTPLSGLNHIDALLDKGPDWNYLTGSSGNVLYYTFSITSGNEAGKSGQEAFSAAQQAATRTAFTYLQQVTGIEFRETTTGTGAQIHLANLNLDGQYTTGLCSWQSSYRQAGNGTLAEYKANAYVYLDNVEWRAANQNLAPGGQGYETLLHELGHALGLKHPFYENNGEQQIVLPAIEDNTTNTLMSYTGSGGYYSAFRPYDIAALNWLYGGDGLRGELGINSNGGGRYITGSYKAETLTGTPYNDTLQGNGGNDMIDGGAGIDTVVFNGNRNAYTFATRADGALVVSNGQDGSDTLYNVEWLRFADQTVERASVVSSDTVAPAAPLLLVTQNAAHYARGNKPTMTGEAEAGSTVRVYIGDQLIATAVAGADRLWSAQSTVVLADGQNYSAVATATDAAGNVSGLSAASTFHVDVTAPKAPTITAAMSADGNQPVFNGTGDAGTMIQLAKINDGDLIELGRTTVGANGYWQIASVPLPNGTYQVRSASSDQADNATSSVQSVTLTINNALNQTGTAGNDSFTMGDGNSAVQGGAGLDTAVFSGNSNNYVLERGVYGFTVFDRAGNGGLDNLVNVERIKFDDTMVALDINGGAGQIYRLYQAAYDRVPDAGGLKFWIDAMDTGNYTLTQIADFFIADKEFQALYMTDPSNENFVDKLYNHVLGRDGDAGGEAFWLARLAEGVSRADVLSHFSESPENQALVIGSIVNGIEYPIA